MKSNHDANLEACISRELKALGELPAPRGLEYRVMRSIEARQRAPWYRSAWQAWPVSLQVASFVLLVAIFGAVCWLGGGVSQTASEAVVAQKSASWFSSLAFVGNILRALGDALLAVLNKAGTVPIVAVGLLVAASWAACACAGTVIFRFAMHGSLARRD
jgi:hypothetical protein